MKLIHWVDIRNQTSGAQITNYTEFDWTMYHHTNSSRTMAIMHSSDVGIAEYRTWTAHEFPTLMRKG